MNNVDFCAIAASLVLFAIGGQVMWLLGLCMAAGCMAGAWLGSIRR